MVSKETAFPSPVIDTGRTRMGPYAGMTLLDYFAAKAMLGELNTRDQGIPKDDENLEAIAYLSYKMAKAMMTVREILEKANE